MEHIDLKFTIVAHEGCARNKERIGFKCVGGDYLVKLMNFLVSVRKKEEQKYFTFFSEGRDG